ncbi:helix-turn-helix domain-containing protein [Aquibacillus albus]|uniref:Excisionase family DNA binding protein n=1 Tax=Aquibacillus albus TaxID=1168171 RepID=A0ABS2N168_9BACI|nr:helix-turn-helix domain-containing protein [Aquibacillus albus]MBM7571884.1 excisionase family DNA binding protein [Aquibacillus albus]
MIDVREQEQEKLWDSILTLSNIDTEQAKVVFKAVIERSLRHVGMFTPFIASIPFRLPDHEHVQLLKNLEKQIIKHIAQQEEEKAYEFLIEYIEALSDLTESDSKIIRRRLMASILRQRCKRTASVPYRLTGKKAIPTITISDEEDEPLYYKPKEVAKRIGVSDQTVRRMCDRGKFPGAYQTDGGHWKIPKDVLITNEEQDQKAEQLFQQIDTKNKEAGDVDEFDL